MGIGTDTPKAKLHIVDTGTSSEQVGLSTTFNYTGGLQTYTVPVGIDSLKITTYGASGGNVSGGPNGGAGGKIVAKVNVTPGELLYVYVGGMDGYNGGGGGGGAGGTCSGGSGGVGGGNTGGVGGPGSSSCNMGEGWCCAPCGGGSGGTGGGGGGGSSWAISTASEIVTESGVNPNANGKVVITSLEEATLYVEGVLAVTGSKNFEIFHPTKPGMKLVHSSLEGPEAGVYYRGQARLDNGQAVITLPDYFEALTRLENRTVLITPIGTGAVLYVEDGVKNGKFTVKTSDSAKNDQKFFWMVQAVRKDIPPLVVEKE